jgi:hypothetical protein
MILQRVDPLLDADCQAKRFPRQRAHARLEAVFSTRSVPRVLYNKDTSREVVCCKSVKRRLNTNLGMLSNATSLDDQMISGV